MKTNSFDKPVSLLKSMGILLLASPLISAAFLMILLSDKMSNISKLLTLSIFTIAFAAVLIAYNNKSLEYRIEENVENPSVYI